jgi:MATE family multidrug resistance protein
VSDKSSIKYIITLSIPIFFANLAIPLVGIVDTALMGNSGNKSFLAATSVATSFFSLIFWSFGFLRMGTVGIVSQSYGKEDYKSILNLIFRNLFFVILISLFLIIFKEQIFSLCLFFFDLSKETERNFKVYFDIRIYSSIFELTIYIIIGLFIGLQKTKISSFAIGSLSILNILISTILVLEYDLNIKGVAYGTLLATFATSLVFLIFLKLKV